LKRESNGKIRVVQERVEKSLLFYCNNTKYSYNEIIPKERLYKLFYNIIILNVRNGD